MHGVQQPRRSPTVCRQLMQSYTQMLLWNPHQRHAYFPLQGSVPAITAVCVGNTLFKRNAEWGLSGSKRLQNLLLYLVFFPKCVGETMATRQCRFAQRNLKKKERKKVFPHSIIFRKIYFGSCRFFVLFFLPNVSSLVPQPGDAGRSPRILAQYFKPRRSLCFGSSDQLDSAERAAFSSGSKVMADGQSLDWLQLYRRCVSRARGTNRSKRVKMFVGSWFRLSSTAIVPFFTVVKVLQPFSGVTSQPYICHCAPFTFR